MGGVGGGCWGSETGMARQRTGGRLVACRADSARPPPALGWAGQPSGRCAPRHATPVASAARQLAPRAQRSPPAVAWRGRLPAARAGRAPGEGRTGHRPGAGLGSARLGRAPVAVGAERRRARRTGCGCGPAVGWWWVATSATGLVAEPPRVWTRALARRVSTVSVTVGPSSPVARPGRTHTDATNHFDLGAGFTKPVGTGPV